MFKYHSTVVGGWGGELLYTQLGMNTMNTFWTRWVSCWWRSNRLWSHCVRLVIRSEVSVDARLCWQTPIPRFLAFILTFAWEQRGHSPRWAHWDDGAWNAERIQKSHNNNTISVCLCVWDWELIISLFFVFLTAHWSFLLIIIGFLWLKVIYSSNPVTAKIF